MIVDITRNFLHPALLNRAWSILFMTLKSTNGIQNFMNTDE